MKLTKDQCDTVKDGGPQLDGCVSAKVKCGDTIIGNTRGGVNRYGTHFYEHNKCTPATTDHDGGDERVYELDLPEPQTRALVYLDKPCGNLDLAAVLDDTDACPTGDGDYLRCEEELKSGREHVDLFNNNPAKWFLIVEGQKDAEGSFALTIQCEKWGSK